jgi:3-phosphoshikimate 1-carboxyvinyltransferase
MIEIKTKPIHNCALSVPGSKSYTHRSLIAAALCDGRCVVENPLRSEDTQLTLAALIQMGIRSEDHGQHLVLFGQGGHLTLPENAIYLANSGTSMRLLIALAALGEGTCTFCGSDRMHQRPIQDLLDGLGQIGIEAASLNHNGCPPVTVTGGGIDGGRVSLDCSLSSQYLSALLLVAPYTRKGLEILVTQGPVSKPYIDMTVEIMARFGVTVERSDYRRFAIRGNQVYRAGVYAVEPDSSQASYFWAAAAVTGRTVKVLGTRRDSRQGDVRLADVLGAMGCGIHPDPDGIAVSGGPLAAVDVDMADMPDTVPTLAVVAAFAKGTTHIRNVSHLRGKESDRLAAVATELSKMGIAAECTDTGLTIQGGQPRGAEIETYNDHRIAMSFAVAGLRVPGVRIRGEGCVEKSFPEFWSVFESLYGDERLSDRLPLQR